MSRIVFLLEFNVSRCGENPKKNHREKRHINRGLSKWRGGAELGRHHTR